jgi:hypothetical protein
MIMARPKKMNDIVVGKLEWAFMKGFNVCEACDYAEIHRDTYYEYLNKNKDFSDKMKRAQTALQRRAKINLAEKIEHGDLSESKYYLERKCKDEFYQKQGVELSGKMEFKNPYAELTIDELKKLVDDG